MNNILSLITIILFFSCSSGTEKEKETIAISTPFFNNYFGIYFLDESDTIPRVNLLETIAKTLPAFLVVDSFPDTITRQLVTFEFYQNAPDIFTPPDLEFLEHSSWDLTGKEKQDLQAAKMALSLGFAGTSAEVQKTIIKINDFIGNLAQGKRAVIIDYTTVESFNPDSWKSRRQEGFSNLKKDISTQITIHLYREESFCRAITLGMGKFCLPDISMKDISCNDDITYANLINLFAQHLLEQGTINKDSTVSLNIEQIAEPTIKEEFLSSLKPNAKKEGEILIKSVAPELGDALNSQLKIVFSNPDFSSPQEEQTHIISQIFGSEDELKRVSHNEELLRVSELARQQLPRLKKLFNDGLEPGSSILLKAPFKTVKGGNEWMWVEVTKWENNRIEGILQNDPFEVPNLKAGAIVNKGQGEIFDYILYKPDGSTEGNETGKIIEKNAR